MASAQPKDERAEAMLGTQPQRQRGPRLIGSEKAREAQERADLAAVCASPEGRRTLWRIIRWAGVWGRIMAPNGDLQYLEGRRDVGITLQEEIIAVDPRLIPQMQVESLDAERVERFEQNSRSRRPDPSTDTENGDGYAD